MSTWLAATLLLVAAPAIGALGACDSGQPSAPSAEAPAEVAVPTASPAPTESPPAAAEPAGEPEAPAQTEGGEPAAADAGQGDDTGEGEAGAEAPPAEPRRVLILGDSLAATGFGVILAKRLDAHPEVIAYRKGKSASGLARPDFFDWMAEGRRQVDLRTPDAVVVIMGGNDGQDLTSTSGKGKRVGWPSEDWNTAYGERMAQFLEQVSAPGRKVIWLGLPKMGMNSLERKLVTIREIQAREVAKMGPAGAYIETTPHLVDEEGELLRLARVGGKNLTIREDDGIHFTMSGSQYLADRVYPEILKAMGIEPVQAEDG